MKRKLGDEKSTTSLSVSEEVKLRTLLVARAMNVDVTQLLDTLLNHISAPSIAQVIEVTMYATAYDNVY
jgi:hypothetical protein